MLTSDFDYPLDPSRIAQSPLRQRDLCRMAVVNRATGHVEHARFKDLGRWLRAGDLLVLNESRVTKCRVPCIKENTGGAVEVFLLEPPGQPGRRFKAFLKPGRSAKPGTRLLPAMNPAAGVFEICSDMQDDGAWVEWLGPEALSAPLLETIGVVPLPPYIERERLPLAATHRIDARYYQTVYARDSGSAAAPTAGLHFTPSLLAKLRLAGVKTATLTLHVGAGTFLPVKTALLEDHIMHSEKFELNQSVIDHINLCKKSGHRVIAVGTTVVRCLEAAFENPTPRLSGKTDIFIRPGYGFKVIDGLITNFHQPKSSLIALVSAFYNREGLLKLYQDCQNLDYRFLSFGDSMFIS